MGTRVAPVGVIGIPAVEGPRGARHGWLASLARGAAHRAWGPASQTMMKCRRNGCRRWAPAAGTTGGVLELDHPHHQSLTTIANGEERHVTAQATWGRCLPCATRGCATRAWRSSAETAGEACRQTHYS